MYLLSALAAGLVRGIYIDCLDKLSEGIGCQLREGAVSLYEFQNFVYEYNAYKALGGNSFIDKIYSDVKTWKVII